MVGWMQWCRKEELGLDRVTGFPSYISCEGLDGWP